jgi:tetratricopeptide (TPR) repeat protein
MKIAIVSVLFTLCVFVVFGKTDEKHIQQQQQQQQKQQVTIKQQEQALIEFELGNEYHKNKNIPEAIVKFQKAIQINPNTSYFYANLGNCLREVGDYEEALITLKQALSLNDNAKNWYNYGVLCHVKGAYSEAILSFDKAIFLEKDYINAYYNKGLSQQDDGQLHEAMKTYQKTLFLSPKRIDAMINYCNILFVIHTNTDDIDVSKIIKNNDDIRVCYENILLEDPNSVRGLVNLGAFYQSLIDHSHINKNICINEGENCRNENNHDKNENIHNNDDKYNIKGDDIKNNNSNDNNHDDDNIENHEKNNDNKVKAVDLYKRALDIDADNVMAKHALQTLTGSFYYFHVNFLYLCHIFG